MVGELVVGTRVGTDVGALDVGDTDTSGVGVRVGDAVGAVGVCVVGANVGEAVVGASVGDAVGALVVGSCVGDAVGAVGDTVGASVRARLRIMPYSAGGSGEPALVNRTLIDVEPSVTTTGARSRYGRWNPLSTTGLTLVNARAPCTSTLNTRVVTPWCQFSTTSSSTMYMPLPGIVMA